MAAFRFFGRPEPVEREIAPDSATSHARPARRAEDLLAPPPDAGSGRWQAHGWGTQPGGGASGPEEWGAAGAPGAATNGDAPGGWAAGGHPGAWTTAAPVHHAAPMSGGAPAGWSTSTPGGTPGRPSHAGDHTRWWASAPDITPGGPGGEVVRPPATQGWAGHSSGPGTHPAGPHDGRLDHTSDPGPHLDGEWAGRSAGAGSWPIPPGGARGWVPVSGDPGWATDDPAPSGSGAPAPNSGGHLWADPQCACAARPGDPHPAEAAALAAAFAADYLSWDEDDPELRAHVLGEYLAARRPVLLGWSGQGRQRADFAVAGTVRPDGDGRVLVDVRVRVTPYRRVPGGRPLPPDDPDEDGPTVPAAAPAPAARGWRGMPGRWVRLSVAVLAAGDRLVVDAEDESEDPWVEPAPDLADDTPEETP